jgi:hypothetical protein
MNQQVRQERALPAADDGDRPAALFHFERAEDPEIHRYSRYRREATVQPACLRVVLDRISHQEETMPTVAHRPSLTMWLLGAVLVAAIALTLALSLGGSGGQPADRGTDTPQAAPHEAPQGPTPAGGHRTSL